MYEKIDFILKQVELILGQQMEPIACYVVSVIRKFIASLAEQ